MARLTAKARKVRMNGGGYRNPSRITTGADVVPGVDHRTIWVRRFRDVQALLISDRGGEDNISEAKKLMVRRIATQEIELLNMETKFALAGGATPEQLNGYNSTANSQRRLLEAIGIERVPRPVSGKGAQPEQTTMPVIDVDPITAEVHKRAFDGSDALLAQLYREKFEREGFSDEPRAINVILPEGYRPPDAPNNEPPKDEEPSS
jgi:hypothetical protein